MSIRHSVGASRLLSISGAHQPEEMRRLAPVAEAATNPERRILLYTERVLRDTHLFQIIWYADRYCELLPYANEAISRLESEPNAAVIMDMVHQYYSEKK